ncbi:MAG TPA: methyltransferase domain-containing protein [Streptosporangiaceae bacterium]|nr:methyltransferase domain-containing protein [Streptosporangiaceae bacterium]
MLSAAYADTRLAALYDALNPPGDSTAFYLSLAAGPQMTILDMGCGTGQLACGLAARGHDVTGADPAAAMLAVARSRPGGRPVHWIETDAASLAVPTRFDLIVMTGHVFQLLLADSAVRAALNALSRHLALGGRIAFETRNPGAREWQYWSPGETRQRVPTADGPADVHYGIRSVAGQLVTYETCIRFPDGERLAIPDTLRFMDQAELAGFLTEAGLTGVTWYGDWDRSPASPASPEIIVIAGRPH